MVIAAIRNEKSIIIIILLTVFLLATSVVKSQDPYNYYYRVWFRDKGENNTAAFLPDQLLSQRAINRREKAGIQLLDFSDIPVSLQYVKAIKQMDFIFHSSSRWMNTALFKTYSFQDTRALLSLSFVEKVDVVKTPSAKSTTEKLDFPSFKADDPLAYQRPLIMLNGLKLHHTGFTGQGVLIAVFDAGFDNADRVSSLAGLYDRKGVRATYDFVSRNKFVYAFHEHGTAVLSVLAGKKEGAIAGTAPSAGYLLLRTEDPLTEFPVEEDFWAAGAEFADSAGADIISSSLGYFTFDDPSMNYKFADMNGQATFVTRVAEMAASKGIIVFASAGNERNNFWQRIIAPSDGAHVIAVGAVNMQNMIAGFSSAGPSADGRIKPDNTAMGVLLPVEEGTDKIVLSSGTSFSCPVLSGMAACLLQAVPETNVDELIAALHRSGDRFTNPDSLYGYGTPDMVKALSILQDNHTVKPEDNIVISPNPSYAGINIIFGSAPENPGLEVFSANGSMVLKKTYPGMTGRVIHLDEFQKVVQGIYFIRLTTGNNTFVKKVIKLKD